MEKKSSLDDEFLDMMRGVFLLEKSHRWLVSWWIGAYPMDSIQAWH